MKTHFYATFCANVSINVGFLAVLVFALCKISQAVHPRPYALSPVYLEYLEHKESLLVDFLTTASTQNPSIQRYLSEYYENVGIFKNKSGATGTFVSSNPILSFQMIRRFVQYFKEESMYEAVAKGIIDKVSIPGLADIEDAMEAVLRLQYIYNLEATELSNGILKGVPTGASLSTKECFQFGELAQESGYFSLALQWYHTALRKLGTNERVPGLTQEKVLQAIQTTIQEHNQDYEESIENGDMYSFSVPLNSKNYSEFSHLSLRNILPSRLATEDLEEGNPYYSQAVEAKMMELCNGKNLQNDKIKSTLRCYLDTLKHPYWTINPLKVEVLSESPKIIQIYDIFSDTWISYLKSVSYSVLERAPQPPEATPRTAAYAWLEDDVIPDIPVSKVVEYITGLNVVGKAAAEELQVAAYAFGGHVAPHHDSFDLGEEEDESPIYDTSGQQVLTFLAYLNEVEIGGFTAFPLIGISIKPVKNSAVLWYTKRKNGEVDNRTLHAACPVIKGQKWIATKWPRIAENILKRPCGLSPDE